MIFYVPGPGKFVGACLIADALEFTEQLSGQLADNIDEYVYPAAVRHANYGFPHPRIPTRLDYFIKQRY